MKHFNFHFKIFIICETYGELIMTTIDQYTRENLITLLNNSMPHITNQYNALCQIINIRNYIMNKNNLLSKKNMYITVKAFLITSIIIGLLGFCYISPLLLIKLSELDRTDIFRLLLVLTIYICIISFEELIYYSSYRIVLKDYNSMLSTAEQDAHELTTYIHNNTKQHTELCLIPFAYQNPQIITTLLNYLYNYRASSWKEVINLYEQERQLNQINNSIQQSTQLNYQMMQQQSQLLQAIQSDINFNAIATAGVIF